MLFATSCRSRHKSTDSWQLNEDCPADNNLTELFKHYKSRYIASLQYSSLNEDDEVKSSSQAVGLFHAVSGCLEKNSVQYDIRWSIARVHQFSHFSISLSEKKLDELHHVVEWDRWSLRTARRRPALLIFIYILPAVWWHYIGVTS